MIDHDSIAPPPSLADILSGGEDLIGRVDFSTRLTTEAGADEPGTTRTRAPRVAAKPAPAAKQGAKQGATQGATLAGKPAEPVVEAAPVVEVAPAAPATRATAAPRGSAKATLRPRLKKVAEQPVDAHDEVEVEEHELVVEPLAESFTEPADHDERVVHVDEHDDEDHDGYDDEDYTFAPPLTTPAPSPYAIRRAVRRPAAAHELAGLTAPSVVPEQDVAYLGLSVDEVAESARTRMRAAEVAHLRHLEAIENEAARRLELLTAQAELDAELIRLHARREAHAIITAARTRTGAASGPSRAERRLAEVGGTFSRFAETLESSIESTTAPDPRYHA